MKVATQFNVAPRTISRVWEHTCSVMEAHLCETMETDDLTLFDTKMLPLIRFPDHVFETRKKGRVGKKKVHDRHILKEMTENIPTTERGTCRDLASQLIVSKDTVHRMIVKEQSFRVHLSSLKPLLNQKNKDATSETAILQSGLIFFPVVSDTIRQAKQKKLSDRRSGFIRDL